MASLTGLSKAIIALAVIGVVGATVWQLGFKNRPGGAAPMAAQPAPKSPSTPALAGAARPAPAAPAAAPVPVPAPVAAAPPPAAPMAPAPPPKAAVPTPEPVAAPAAPRVSTAEDAEAGRKYLHNGEFNLARVHLERAVKGGDAASACHLGEMTLAGQGGIVANRDKAAELFRVAQAGGVICFTLAK
jgi:hypothetical protein